MFENSFKDVKIIYEQATASDIEILEESTKFNDYKIKFRAKLQESGTVNNNKRIYPRETLEQVYIQLKEKATSRKLVGEMDHPQPQGDQAAKVKRSSTLSLDRACILITGLDWDGNSIYGICETLSNAKGRDLYALLKDKVTIGFSLRAFGETKTRSDGIIEVLPKGLKSICYDVVANPSHDSSVILEFLNENQTINDLYMEINKDISLLKNNKQLIQESIDPNLKKDTKLCFGENCLINPLEETVDYLIQNGLKNHKNNRVKFNYL